MKKIAFFDFDGTITRADTMLEIFKFHTGIRKFYTGMTANLFYLLAMKLGWMSTQTTKEKLLSWFFGGMTEKEFDEVCRSFSERRLPVLIRAEAMTEIHKLRDAGFEIAVVTASPSAWVRYWTSPLNLDLISSKMEIKDGRVTGKLTGRNCNYEEKVNQIKYYFTLKDYDTIYAYGDSKGDSAMLSLATHPFYRSFGEISD